MLYLTSGLREILGAQHGADDVHDAIGGGHVATYHLRLLVNEKRVAVLLLGDRQRVAGQRDEVVLQPRPQRRSEDGTRKDMVLDELQRRG